MSSVAQKKELRRVISPSFPSSVHLLAIVGCSKKILLTNSATHAIAMAGFVFTDEIEIFNGSNHCLSLLHNYFKCH